VYMKLPPGHPQSNDPKLVCKLHKSIYGLKQSPHAWYAKLSTVLTELGFTRSNADHSSFVRIKFDERLMVLIYVDDLIVTGNNHAAITSLKNNFHQQFSTKDLGVLKYFLGIEMTTSHKWLFFNQRKYVLDLFCEVDMLECKPTKTPLDNKLQLTLDEESFDQPQLYQKMVGKLIYLTITRSGLSHSVSIVSQFMHSLTAAHMMIVKWILRYLKCTIGRGILMQNHDHTQILGYTDVDWAGNNLDRKFTTGYCIFVGENLVSWKSKKQLVVAHSSVEAEYCAMTSTAFELI